MYYNQAYASQYRGGCGSWGPKGPWHSGMHKYFRPVPVNIIEKEDSFELYLYAPGLIKENIRVSAKDDILTISYTSPKQEGESKEENFTRKEYNYDSFERSFFLNGKVDIDNIRATYNEGVLKVVLPKNPATNKPAQEVRIN